MPKYVWVNKYNKIPTAAQEQFLVEEAVRQGWEESMFIQPTELDLYREMGILNEIQEEDSEEIASEQEILAEEFKKEMEGEETKIVEKVPKKMKINLKI